MPERTLLLTGFGAFPGVVDNPTAHIAARLDGLRVPGRRVQSLLLPVAWPRVRQEVAEQVAATDPQTIVHLGVAMQAAVLRIETQGVNLLQFRVPDIDGYQPMDGPIEALAPSVLDTTVPVAALAAQMRAAGFETYVSHDAGRYVCNATYFSSLHAFPDRHVLFIHVPPVSDAWPLPRLTRAIEHLLHSLAAH